MSPTPVRERAPEAPQSFRTDARLHPRYPIALDLQYKLLNKGRVERFGFGRTVNISSGGVLFEANDILETNDLRDNSGIILKMNWPVLLYEGCALSLVLSGRIVRNDAARLAVRIEHLEFRTARITAQRAIPRTGHGG